MDIFSTAAELALGALPLNSTQFALCCEHSSLMNLASCRPLVTCIWCWVLCDCPPVQHLYRGQQVRHAQPPDSGCAAASCPGEEGAPEGEQDPADLAFVPQEHFARECRALIGLVQADLRRLEAARSRRARSPAAAAARSASAPPWCLAARRSECTICRASLCGAVRSLVCLHAQDHRIRCMRAGQRRQRASAMPRKPSARRQTRPRRRPSCWSAG